MKLICILLFTCFFARGSSAAENVLAPKLVSIPPGKIKTSTCTVGVAICPYHDYVERVVNIPAFEISETEVTFAEWDECVKDGGCVSEVSDWAYMNRPVHPPCVADEACQYPYDESWGRDKRPVISVSWDDVQQYLRWLNTKTEGRYRLPTSEEWEYVAVAGSRGAYSRGATGKENAKCDGCGNQWDNHNTAPVASFKPNRFGVYDMLGNVHEWVSTCFPSRAKGSQECNTYIYRGGWSTGAKSMSPRFFDDHFSTIRANYIGFRLAR
jgi:sulfatase modifying factor 1